MKKRTEHRSYLVVKADSEIDDADLMSELAERWDLENSSRVDNSSAISALSPEDLTLLNRLFGSDAICVGVQDKDIQRAILKLMPHDLYRNFRRATHNRNQPVLVEDWLWETSLKRFIKALENELDVLELVLAGFLIYLLNGFKIPRDPNLKHLGKFIRVDASALLDRKADIFLLGRMTPGVTSRYLYWKLTSVLMGLMRLYARKDTLGPARKVKKIMLGEHGIKTQIRQG